MLAVSFSWWGRVGNSDSNEPQAASVPFCAGPGEPWGKGSERRGKEVAAVEVVEEDESRSESSPSTSIM